MLELTLVSAAGNRYTSPSFFRMETRRKATAEGGFSHAITFDKTPPLGESSETVQEFLPPTMVRIKSKYANGCQSLLALYATPTKPGYVRHIGCQVRMSEEGRERRRRREETRGEGERRGG
eukprot:394835-Hanusia_phi.AAC.2